MQGISASFSKALTRCSVASISKCESQDVARVLSASRRHLHGKTVLIYLLSNCSYLKFD